MPHLLPFIIIATIFIVTLKAHAQSHNVLDSLRVNLEVKDLALREALQQLVRQTQVQLVYHDALVAGIKTSCSLKNATLGQALEKILEPADLTYRLMDDSQIVIVWRGWMTGPLEHRSSSEGSGFRPPPFGMDGPPPGSPERIEMALKMLDLSATQQARIDSMQNAQREKVFALLHKRQTGELDFEKFRSEHHKLADDMMKQMQGVLTNEQYQKLERAIEPQSPPRGSFPPFRPGGGTPHQPPPRRR